MAAGFFSQPPPLGKRKPDSIPQIRDVQFLPVRYFHVSHAIPFQAFGPFAQAIFAGMLPDASFGHSQIAPMKKLLFCAALLLGPGQFFLCADSALEAGWDNPPNEARLRAYWWWLNGNVTKASIT